MAAGDQGYLALLRIRGAAPLVVGVSLARFVYGVLPLAFLLLLVERRGSYGEAGTVVALEALTAGLLGPTRARLMDRYGTRRVLLALAVAYAAALVGFAAVSEANLVLVTAVALLVGAVGPPIGPLMRQTWRQLVGEDENMLRRAYSFDAVSEEVLYVVAPPVGTVAVASVGASAVILGAAVTVVVAALGIAAWLPRFAGADDQTSALAPNPPLWRNIRLIRGLIPVSSLAFLLGGLEVGMAAAALATVGESLSGVPAAVLSAGSVAGGLIFGRRSWPGTASTQARVLAFAAAVLVAMAALAAAVFPVMLVFLAVTGACIAPAIVCSYLIADEAAPVPGAEATAWVNSAFNVSLAAGLSVTGVLLDVTSVGGGLLIVAAMTTIVVLASPSDLPLKRAQRPSTMAR